MTEHSSLPDLNGVFPAREIKIKKHGLAHLLLYPFLSIIFAFASVGIAVAWFPGLYKDHLIMNDPLVGLSYVEYPSKEFNINSAVGRSDSDVTMDSPL